MKEKKVIFSDLDGTLIETLSGQTFQQGAWDVKLKLDVWAKIKELFTCEEKKFLCIVTNQGGIETGKVNPDTWVAKAKWINAALEEYLGEGWKVDVQACTSHDDNNPYRKPNTGMLMDYIGDVVKWTYPTIELKNIIMIGDASGKPGDWSDSDLVTARRLGCDYVDVRDFMEM